MSPPPRDLLLPGLAVLGAILLVVAATRSPGEAVPPPMADGPTTTSTTTSLPIIGDLGTEFQITQSDGSPAIVVTPDEDLAAIVAAARAGTTFVLAEGIHRSDTIIPADGQTFLGRPGAVLSGAIHVETFTPGDGLWAAGGQTAESRVHGTCEPDRPRCVHAEDLFLDDVALRHVGSRAQVGPGTWFFDYAADTIYLGDDPAGRIVELSVVPAAFRGAADQVTIRGLAIEKFAVPAQQGAIDSRADTEDLVGGAGWSIRDNIVRWNHGVGIAATTGAMVSDNVVYENGQMGLAAKGAGVTFENNEVYRNNTAGFSSGWEAGGSKFAFTSGLVVRNNHVYENFGPGLWTDIDNIDTLYEGNRVVDNERMGIFHEISYDAVIRNNEVRGNGFGFDEWVWGAGIIVSTSSNVEVYDNVVEGNADGIIGVHQDRSDAPASYGPLQLVNLAVHGNVIADNGGWTGIGQDVGSNQVFTDFNNRFFDNTYRQDGEHFFWLNEPRSQSEWERFGQN
ncbi:MAG: right-handed parallel beta-helix repeat-containing protein [Acidimicrobiia bacterium]|nr:right-handed parallel beta-helix repeat-containing protein [Acidimicrobiia bacterium]MBT8215259.1 right-handed parallel beta-helix repeat-containing protein [Acidimicrobiia bacterium]NNF10825.1 right-handed parallel beta-helix repeat-containing protein [Acidimicrobiia bacterium]NNL70650.1 right-handed parallel beta-helix repeat-containing protein [Acidimicrobiia bacterium]